MLFSVIICRIWSFATAIDKLLFDKNCHICNSYQKGAIFYQSHKVFYTTARRAAPVLGSRFLRSYVPLRCGPSASAAARDIRVPADVIFIFPPGYFSRPDPGSDLLDYSPPC